MRTPTADALSRLSYQVLQLSALLSEAGDELSQPAGQSSARWQVMAAIEHAPLSVADIARQLGQARQSVQRLADVMTEGGFTAYHDNPAHKRAKLLGLTENGYAALRDIQQRQIVWANRVSVGLDPQALAQASATLREVQQALLAQPD